MQWKRKIILATTCATHIIVLRATISTAFHTRYYSLRDYNSFLTTATRKFNTNRSRRNLIFLELSSPNRRNYSDTKPINMPRGVKKENLPSKICVTCNRPFTWRKKWERVWDEVTTCSKSCNRKRRIANKQQRKGKEEDKDDVANSNGFLSSVEDVESEDEPIIPIEYPHIPELRHLKITENSSGDEDDNNSVHSEERIELGEDPTTCDDDPVVLAKKQRKALKKAKKAERRAQREGRGDPTAGQKKCDMCGKSVNLLIRCMYEEGQVDWKMVCGKCWNVASGGVVDGDSDHPHYKYGGLWKNRRAQT